MEVQDTVMEARGPSDLNTVDTAASQPRYSLRSTDKVNKRESSVTKVDPHHCAIAETEKQHSSPQPPHSPDLTIVMIAVRLLANNDFYYCLFLTSKNATADYHYRLYFVLLICVKNI